MRPGAVYAAALDGGAELHSRDKGGVRRTLSIGSWMAPADATDERLLARAAGPVLDVGCGPGRHVHALQRRGVAALGLDASPVAVRLARSRGADVHEGSVFDVVPGCGTWRTALLLDGNVGIGGDPARLLTRVAALLMVGGLLLVECDAPGMGLQVGPVRLEGAALVSRWFSWARVGAEALDDIAPTAGLTVTSRWDDGGRWFASLTKR